MREYSQLSTISISLFIIWSSPTKVMRDRDDQALLWSHLRSKSYMCKGQILGIYRTFPRWRSLSCSILIPPPPSKTCRYFLQEDLESVLRPASRWSIHRNASPGSASADGCSLQRSTSHHELASRFPAGTNFLLIIEIGGMVREGYSGYVQHYWHNDDTACVSTENGTFGGQKNTAYKISPARVVHPTLLSGLIHYQAILFGSTQLLFLFDCARLKET